MQSSTNTPPDKKFYNITEVAKMFKVASSLLRYWESEFDILKPGKDEKGNRQYTKEDLDNLQKVYYLVKKKGYTLRGAKSILQEEQSQQKTDFDVLNSLIKVKSLLVDLREKIR